MTSKTQSRQDIETQIIVRALKNDAFKQQLLSDPNIVKAEIEKVLGQKLPDGFKVQVLQETDSQAYLVLPAAPAGEQGLSEQQIETVASGARNLSSLCMFSLGLFISTDEMCCFK